MPPLAEDPVVSSSPGLLFRMICGLSAFNLGCFYAEANPSASTPFCLSWQNFALALKCFACSAYAQRPGWRSGMSSHPEAVPKRTF